MVGLLRQASRLTGLLALGLALGWAGIPYQGTAAETEKTAKISAADEAPFTYDRNDPERSRDPFTFLKKALVKSTSQGPIAGPTPQAELTATAQQNYEQAEKALKNFKAKDAISFCDKGLDAFKKYTAEQKQEGYPDNLLDLHERFFRLRRAAERMLKRSDAETAFKNLNIKVTGTVVKEHGSRAIINNKVTAKGAIVDLGGKESELIQVVDITPNRVTVLFRGYKMELAVIE